jgi:alpha,alpha-trehalase
MGSPSRGRAPAPQVDAVVFDVDGVVTDTASVHARAWAAVFDDFLAQRAARTGERFAPFTADDYRRYVDGLPRYDGVERFLRSRRIDLVRGDPADPADAETVHGLGNRKNEAFLAEVGAHGVEPFESTRALLRELRRFGIPTAAVSASENCGEVLRAAGVVGCFDVRVDGTDARELGLAPKPDPAIFLEAARRLGVEPGRAAVVEDALAGVEAGRRGGFGLVVGVDRTGHPDDLATSGADVVVSDLASLMIDSRGTWSVVDTAGRGGPTGTADGEPDGATSDVAP